MANDDDVMDEDSETDEFITASENEVEDEDSEEDEFAKQIREPKELVVYKIIKGVRCTSLEVWGRSCCPWARCWIMLSDDDSVDAEFQRQLRQLSSIEDYRRLSLALQTGEREPELETDAQATEWVETETFDAGRHSMKSCDEEEHEECSGVAAAAAPPDEMRLPEESEAEPAEVGRTSTTRHRAGRMAHTFERFTRFVDGDGVGAGTGLTGLTAGDT